MVSVKGLRTQGAIVSTYEHAGIIATDLDAALSSSTLSGWDFSEHPRGEIIVGRSRIGRIRVSAWNCAGSSTSSNPGGTRVELMQPLPPVVYAQ
jgi:hypothetical protein